MQLGDARGHRRIQPASNVLCRKSHVCRRISEEDMPRGRHKRPAVQRLFLVLFLIVGLLPRVAAMSMSVASSLAETPPRMPSDGGSSQEEEEDDEVIFARNAVASSSSAAITTSLPRPFDTSLGNNFTQASCPTFFNTFLNDSSFQACHPVSLLLQVKKNPAETNSPRAERNPPGLTNPTDIDLVLPSEQEPKSPRRHAQRLLQRRVAGRLHIPPLLVRRPPALELLRRLRATQSHRHGSVRRLPRLRPAVLGNLPDGPRQQQQQQWRALLCRGARKYLGPDEQLRVLPAARRAAAGGHRHAEWVHGVSARHDGGVQRVQGRQGAAVGCDV